MAMVQYLSIQPISQHFDHSLSLSSLAMKERKRIAAGVILVEDRSSQIIETFLVKKKIKSSS
ncbi:hypothetical protein Scep_023808 [Stephania cephalantha]|uniref:Uncharacterized protein n=1 Tax=Stephania cephalantha TaxID=152367 RepID=A0AAP0HT47_9MAGN